jgi:hypothetical protein
MLFLFIDLNFFLPYSHSKTIRGVAHVNRENCILTTHGLFANVRISKVR